MSESTIQTATQPESISENWLVRGQNSVMNTYGRFPLTLVRGEGCRVWGADGKAYLDFVAGIAVNTLGHSHPKLSAAIAKQAGELMHCSNLYWIPQQIELAEVLTTHSPFGKAFFCNSGAEAVEAALKLARKYSLKKYGPGRSRVIAMQNSFHGRTYGAMTLTGQAKYSQNFTPLVPEIVHTTFNDFTALAEAVTSETCAILIEPVQGEGGIQPADAEFLRQVRALCDERDIVLIFDEVQTGIGRTGKLFAFEHTTKGDGGGCGPVVPDVIALAKGLGGGFPIGAMLAVEQVASAFEPGDHASTFGGNSLACTAALTVLDELLNNGLLAQTVEAGAYLKEKLQALQTQCPSIKDVRGLGLMQGIELDCPAADVVKACMARGLLLVGAGPNVIRFVPPQIVTKAEIDEAIGILEGVLKEVESA